MIDNRLRDNNGDNISSYHQRHFFRMTGFPDYHNTNIDKVCQFLDEPTFKSFLEFQEQDRAYDIDYAHGLELDDMFGDPFGIDRNGLDDTEYRFILKCHMLAINCNGTLPELVRFISSVLDCDPHDVSLGMARHYTKTGKLVGEPDTILINKINIEKINNDKLVALLADQLQSAVAADKQVKSVDFYVDLNEPLYAGVDVVARANAIIPLKNEIGDHLNLSNQEIVGMSVKGRVFTTIPLRNEIHEKTWTPLNPKVGIGVKAHAISSIKLNKE